MPDQSFKAGLALLRERDFARLFVAYLISYFGTAMAPIAVAFGVLDLTGSTSDSAIVIAASTTGQIMVLLIGGTLADRTSRHHLIIIADVISLCSQLGMAWLFLSGQATVPLLAGLMLITGMANALHQPAITGFIPQIVPREKLQAANALLGTARNGSLIMGAAGAGILVATVGPGITIAIDGLSFGLSAILVMTLRPTMQSATEAASFLTDIRLGWEEFVSHKWLWTIVLQFSFIVAAIDSVFGLLGPAVAKSHLGGAVAWGIISAGFGVGTLTGGLTAIKLNIERPMLVGSILVLFFSSMPLALAVPLSVPLIVIAAFVAGFTGQIFGTVWYTTLQTHVPPHLLSRVSAYDHMGSIGMAPLGIVAFGYLYELIGHRDTMLLCAAFIVVPTLAVLCVKEVRDLRKIT